MLLTGTRLHTQKCSTSNPKFAYELFSLVGLGARSSRGGCVAGGRLPNGQTAASDCPACNDLLVKIAEAQSELVQWRDGHQKLHMQNVRLDATLQELGKEIVTKV